MLNAALCCVFDSTKSTNFILSRTTEGHPSLLPLSTSRFRLTSGSSSSSTSDSRSSLHWNRRFPPAIWRRAVVNSGAEVAQRLRPSSATMETLFIHIVRLPFHSSHLLHTGEHISSLEHRRWLLCTIRITPPSTRGRVHSPSSECEHNYDGCWQSAFSLQKVFISLNFIILLFNSTLSFLAFALYNLGENTSNSGVSRSSCHKVENMFSYFVLWTWMICFGPGAWPDAPLNTLLKLLKKRVRRAY